MKEATLKRSFEIEEVQEDIPSAEEYTAEPQPEIVPDIEQPDATIENILGSGVGDEPENPAPKKKPRAKKVPKEDPRAVVNKCGPFPGGPGDNKLLKTFYDHIALKIWLGQERPPLRCLHHTKNLHEWKINAYHESFKVKLENTGLHVLSYALPQLNRCLISSIVERWQPETSSFHLPFGEMTITLDDVKQITGLSIEGEMLHSFVIENIEQGVDLVKRTLGLDPAEIRKEFKTNSDQLCVRLVWLREMMKCKEVLDTRDSGNETSENETVREDPNQVDYVVRGYILYSLGCNLFADKSGSRVNIAYLKYLENLDEVHKYAWGTSGLAFLYKALSDASRHNVAQIMGYLSLLEVWVYEHISPLKGKVERSYCEPKPRMKRWLKCGGVTNPETTLIVMRQTIDNLSIHDVVWDPYKEVRTSARKLGPISFYEGLITSVGAVAPYMPNRVLRQFGLRQIIPFDPTNTCGEYFSQWINHVVDPSKRLLITEGQSDWVDGYMQWYFTNTHPKVQNPSGWVGPAPVAKSATDSRVEYKKIKELKIATQESPSSFNDDDDIGTEHRNRSRVNGCGVTPSKLGFPPPNDDRVALLEQKVNELTEKVSSMETMKQEMQEQMKAMQNLVNQLMQNQPQCGCNKPEGVKCKLFRMVKDDIVAEGRWVTDDPSTVVHDIPLGHGSSKVWVDCAVEPTARLWRPAGDMERMKDAVGSVIAWPTDSIINEGI